MRWRESFRCAEEPLVSVCMKSITKTLDWLRRDSSTPSLPCAPSRRILLLTQVFPPHTEVGAARWEGFAPFLNDEGWGLDVVIEAPQDSTYVDWDRFGKLPQCVRVTTCTRENPAWLTFAKKIRSTVTRGSGNSTSGQYPSSAVGDRGLLYQLRNMVDAIVRTQQAHQLVRGFIEKGLAIAGESPSLLVSSGPAHFVHVAGHSVSKQMGLPHVVDLRDPWAGQSKGLVSSLLPDEELGANEVPTLSDASLVITNTHAAEKALLARMPRLVGKTCCIPNGSDLIPMNAKRGKQHTFQIVHCGTLYIDRDPRPFLEAVAKVIRDLGIRPGQIKVVFMGEPSRIAGKSLTQTANEIGLGGYFEEREPGTRQQARELLCEAAMAVAFQGQNTTQIPAKIFEYVAFPVWLLGLVGRDSATADILNGTSAFVLDISEVSEIARIVSECYALHSMGVNPDPVGKDGRFSRATQATKLLAEFRKLVPL